METENSESQLQTNKSDADTSVYVKEEIFPFDVPDIKIENEEVDSNEDGINFNSNHLIDQISNIHDDSSNQIISGSNQSMSNSNLATRNVANRQSSAGVMNYLNLNKNTMTSNSSMFMPYIVVNNSNNSTGQFTPFASSVPFNTINIDQNKLITNTTIPSNIFNYQNQNVITIKQGNTVYTLPQNSILPQNFHQTMYITQPQNGTNTKVCPIPNNVFSYTQSQIIPNQINACPTTKSLLPNHVSSIIPNSTPAPVIQTVLNQNNQVMLKSTMLGNSVTNIQFANPTYKSIAPKPYPAPPVIESDPKKPTIKFSASIKSKSNSDKSKPLYVYKFSNVNNSPMIEFEQSNSSCFPSATKNILKASSKSSRTISFSKVNMPAPTRVHRCPYCPELFKQKSSVYFKHIKNHTETKSYPCAYCNLSFKLCADYKAHITLKHTDQMHKCTYCDRKYISKFGFDKHIKIHKGELFSCEECGESFTEKESLAEHVNTHKERCVLVCEYCGKKFTSRSGLYMHKNKHLQLNICSVCGKQCSNKIELNGHAIIHANDMKPYTCEFCKKKYETNFELTRHIKVHHTDNQRFQCKYCRKECKTQAYLWYHTQFHTCQYICSCAYCDKGFTSKNKLEMHIRIHMNDKPYVCYYCNKKFSSKPVLNLHMKIHRENKDFTCDYCGKKFSRKLDMVYHIVTHTKEKGYVCQYCDKGFTQSSSLMSHIRGIHHNIRPFICDICQRTFARKTDIAYHIQKKHNMGIS